MSIVSFIPLDNLVKKHFTGALFETLYKKEIIPYLFAPDWQRDIRTEDGILNSIVNHFNDSGYIKTKAKFHILFLCGKLYDEICNMNISIHKSLCTVFINIESESGDFAIHILKIMHNSTNTVLFLFRNYPISPTCVYDVTILELL
jgi:hypothetical protein